MKKIDQVKTTLHKNWEVLRNDYHVRRIRIFGSYARGEATKKSDIDILVEYKQTPNLFKFLELEEFLSRKLKIRVDLVTPRALKRLMKKSVLGEAIAV